MSSRFPDGGAIYPDGGAIWPEGDPAIRDPYPTISLDNGRPLLQRGKSAKPVIPAPR